MTHYRYPTGGDDTYPGPERVYRIHVPAGAANFGVAVLSGNVVPHVTFDGSEDRLAGYTALPLDLNPYRKTLRRCAGASRRSSCRPAAPTTSSSTAPTAGGRPFTFRYWVNDVTPPRLRVRSTRGVDRRRGDRHRLRRRPVVDRGDARREARRDALRLRRDPHRGGEGTRTASCSRVADYQETKNMEDVAKILPNTRDAPRRRSAVR